MDALYQKLLFFFSGAQFLSLAKHFKASMPVVSPSTQYTFLVPKAILQNFNRLEFLPNFFFHCGIHSFFLGFRQHWMDAGKAFEGNSQTHVSQRQYRLLYKLFYWYLVSTRNRQRFFFFLILGYTSSFLLYCQSDLATWYSVFRGQIVGIEEICWLR